MKILATLLKGMIFPLLLISGIVIYHQFGDYINTDYLEQQSAAMQNYYRQHPFTTAFLFTLFCTLYMGLAMPGAQITPVAAGLFFGYFIGLLISIICYAIGPALTFLLARHVLGNTLQERFADRLAAINRGFEKDGFWYLYILRQLPTPFLIVNLCMGLTSMRLYKYIWVNSLCLLPGSISGAYLGFLLSGIAREDDFFTPQFIIISMLILAASPLVAKLIYEILKRRRQV